MARGLCAAVEFGLLVAAIVSNIVARPQATGCAVWEAGKRCASVVDAIMDNESFDARLKQVWWRSDNLRLEGCFCRGSRHAFVDSLCSNFEEATRPAPRLCLNRCTVALWVMFEPCPLIVDRRDLRWLRIVDNCNTCRVFLVMSPLTAVTALLLPNRQKTLSPSARATARDDDPSPRDSPHRS